MIIIISIIGSRRNGAGNDIGHVVFFYPIGINSKGLLVDHGVHITWRTVAAEAEVSEAVYNIPAFISFYALKYMRMMSAYKISAFIDRDAPKCCLVAVRNGFRFITPVEDHYDQLCPVCLYFCNIVF